MRYQVPQFIDIEDKIIGPFTLKQFMIYVVTVMLLIPVYLASDLSLFVIIALPAIGIAALFAHFKLHGKSLFTIIGLGTAFFTRGQLFIWRRTSKVSPLKITGDEYADYAIDQLGSTTSLNLQSQNLATSGHITSEDLEDVIVDEQEVTAEDESSKNK